MRTVDVAVCTISVFNGDRKTFKTRLWNSCFSCRVREKQRNRETEAKRERDWFRSSWSISQPQIIFIFLISFYLSIFLYFSLSFLSSIFFFVFFGGSFYFIWFFLYEVLNSVVSCLSWRSIPASNCHRSLIDSIISLSVVLFSGSCARVLGRVGLLIPYLRFGALFWQFAHFRAHKLHVARVGDDSIALPVLRSTRHLAGCRTVALACSLKKKNYLYKYSLFVWCLLDSFSVLTRLSWLLLLDNNKI